MNQRSKRFVGCVISVFWAFFAQGEDLVRWVDPLIGTVGEGNTIPGAAYPFGKDGQIGQYWHGNEPSHHVVYFYTLMGAPEKAARLVRALCRDAYKARPDGLCGNDDCGQMSAWYLFSTMGFYPFNPCDDGYVFGAPQAEEMTVKVKGEGEDEKTLVIKAKNLSEKNVYVKSVTLNGTPVTDWKIRHEDIVKGGELIFEMGMGK